MSKLQKPGRELSCNQTWPPCVVGMSCCNKYFLAQHGETLASLTPILHYWDSQLLQSITWLQLGTRVVGDRLAGGRGKVWSLSGDLIALESRILGVAGGITVITKEWDTVRLIQGVAGWGVAVVEVQAVAVRVGRMLY